MTYNATKMRELRARRRDERPRTLAESLRRQVVAEYEQSSKLAFPCTQYQNDIDGFARRVLGMRSTRKQRRLYKIAEQLYRAVPGEEIKRGAVSSCVKSGKTRTIAVLALWRYCCWEDSRTLLTGPGERSVQKLAWREVRILKARSGVCVDCRAPGVKSCEHSAPVPGDCSEQARTGLRGLGFSEVFGLVAKVDVNLQGYSDPTLSILGDESVAIGTSFYDALHGNMSSSVNGFEMWFSNPNSTGNWFHNAFTKNAQRWVLDKISAFDICDEGVPGIITRATINEVLEDYGEESDNYQIRILGNFPKTGSGGLFTAALLDGAVAAWQSTREGMLALGVDPATSEDNDPAGFAVRRGLSIQHMGLEFGLSKEAIWQHVEGLIAEYGNPGEPCAVAIDSNGIGYELCIYARTQLNGRPIQIVQVRPSDGAVRKMQIYRGIRDELVDNFREWLRDGGTLPPGESDMCCEEALCFGFAEGKRGLLVATPKKLIKKQLGRSPDSFDAACLAAWVKTVAPRRARAPGARGGATPQQHSARAAAAGTMARLKAGASSGGRGLLR